MGRGVEGSELQSPIDYSGPFKGGALGPTSGPHMVARSPSIMGND